MQCRLKSLECWKECPVSEEISEPTLFITPSVNFVLWPPTFNLQINTRLSNLILYLHTCMLYYILPYTVSMAYLWFKGSTSPGFHYGNSNPLITGAKVFLSCAYYIAPTILKRAWIFFSALKSPWISPKLWKVFDFFSKARTIVGYHTSIFRESRHFWY